MFKRTIVAVITFAALLCFTVTGDAADVRPGKDDTWLVYWYICGADNLEGIGHLATKDIAEMQKVKLPPNVKVLIYAGGTNRWHHPTIAANGDGIYLYSSNRLEKQVDGYANNMGDPNTLASFLKYGEDNFPADHKILLFWNHGGLSGVCYDDKFAQRNDKGEVVDRPYLTYDALKGAFAAVYGNSPEEPPFELVGFKACMTGSYELANSLADFSRYMMGAEPSVYDWNFSDWFADLAKDPSMNGAKLGKAICDSALKSYNSYFKATHTFSIIDLSKMPELREAYEAYFDEAARRANDETGFSGAFARAATAGNVDRYSNWYGDLGLIAKNTKSIMPEASKKLLDAIDKAVVYNKRGEYLKSKGISTYYPYISSEKPAMSVESSEFKTIDAQSSSYAAQKNLYRNLLGLNVSQLNVAVPVERDSNGHLVARLTPEQLENVSMIRCLLLPVEKTDNGGIGSFRLGESILNSADDLKIDLKTGTITENFRAVEQVFDGHKIAMFATVSGRGHNFYEVPIILGSGVEKKPCTLKVRYDISAKKYTIFGFGSEVENGMVRDINAFNQLRPGDLITPVLFTTVSDDEINGADDPTILNRYTDPKTGKNVYLKVTAGTTFVFTRDSAITDRKITRGNYVYVFSFMSPNGNAAMSRPGLIQVKHGEITRFTEEDDLDEDDL